MLTKLFHSTIIGALIAALLLFVLPSLRNGTDNMQAFHDDDQPASFNQAARSASPAVVNVYNRSANRSTSSDLEIRTLGSGVIMNKQGYILTNKHVISNAEQIIVALQDSRVFEAHLVGSDQLTDLAVLKIEASNLPYITINASRPPHVGDVVLAIGNPYNLGQTVTQGIISATGRIGLSPSGRQNFLQTDASINHGNSGGALVNTLGELVGINTLSLTKSNDGETPEGIGFAIPTLLANKIMEKLIRDGRVIRGYIGIEGREVAPHFAPENNKPIQGISVGAVNTAGPAALAGILPGDIILKVNGQPTVSVIETMDQIAEIHPGTVLPVEIYREGKIIERKVTIIEYPLSKL